MRTARIGSDSGGPIRPWSRCGTGWPLCLAPAVGALGYLLAQLCSQVSSSEMLFLGR